MGRKTGRMDPTVPPNSPYYPREAKSPRGLEAQMESTGSTKAGTGLPNQETTRPNHSPPTQHLPKAESAMFVQLRTGRTGLRHLLSKVQVPGYESEQCSCGTGPETPRYILLHCTRSRAPHSLREAQGGQLDFTRLLDTPKGAQWSASG